MASWMLFLGILREIKVGIFKNSMIFSAPKIISARVGDGQLS
jgi:hypothetical protein